MNETGIRMMLGAVVVLFFGIFAAVFPVQWFPSHMYLVGGTGWTITGLVSLALLVKARKHREPNATLSPLVNLFLIVNSLGVIVMGMATTSLYFLT